MKQIEFHSNGRRWLLQSLPDASFVHCEVNGNTLCMGRVPDEGTIVKLPPGDWRILGVAGEVVDSEDSMYSPFVGTYPPAAYDYEKKEMLSNMSASESFNSLLRSHGFNPTTTLILVDQSTQKNDDKKS